MASSSSAATTSANIDNSVPTAKFLQSRIETLRNALISRLENIFATSMDDVPASADADEPSGGDGTAISPAPPLTETATRQLTLTIETTALIRAAEEILVLTRGMKELWLFGGLHTIPDDGEDVRNKQEELKKKESEVVKGMIEFLGRLDALDEIQDEKRNRSVRETSDVEMD